MKKVTVLENQKALRIQNGLVTGIVGPGTYRENSLLNRSYFVHTMSELPEIVAINCASKDNAAIATEINFVMQIVNLKEYYLSSASTTEHLYRLTSKLVGEYTSQRSLKELLDAGIELDNEVLKKETLKFGFIARVEGVIRIRLPRNLQNAIDAQEVARQKARAELEEARGRTAVLRHYANAAKITKDNPEIMRLLLGQKAKSINVSFDTRK